MSDLPPDADGGWDPRWAQSNARQALGALLSIPKLLRDRGDPDARGVVRGDARAQALFDVARNLGRAGREDQETVRELRAMAGDRRRTLEIAEQLSRLGGLHREDPDRNRTYRLIRAALDDEPVAAVSVREQEKLALLEAVLNRSRPDEDVWRELTMRRPQLAQLLVDVRAGVFGPRHQVDARRTVAPPQPAEQKQQLAASRGGLALMDALEKLVGPTSAGSDPVITSRRAQHRAWPYLERQRPTGPARHG